LEEQVCSQILGEYQAEEKRHVFEKEYTSDTSHQDGDLPYRIQLTYEDGGPSYYVNDYFPHFHYQAAATLAHENYELLIDYWGTRDTTLEDLETESNAIHTLCEGGAADNIRELNLE
jgi:hypothetical protein